MTNKFLKTYKREFTKSNCGFDHEPVDAIVRSQWQSRSQSLCYLLYRWIWAIVAVTSVVVSFVSHIEHYSFGLFFIYLTHWGILVNAIVAIYGTVLVTCWHFYGDFRDNVSSATQMPATFKAYWALHNIALITSFCVTIIYWSILHNATIPVNASNVLSHAMNSVLMLLDILIVSSPLRLYHMIQPIAFGISFGIFSYIYYLCGGVDVKGNPYIYNVLDWNKPDKAMVTVAGTLILSIIVHTALFWVYKLRMFVQRRCFATTLILPTTTSSKQRLAKTTMGSSQISMVFGETDGHTNEAFRTQS